MVSSCIFNCSSKLFTVYMVWVWSMKRITLVISIFCCGSPFMLETVCNYLTVVFMFQFIGLVLGFQAVFFFVKSCFKLFLVVNV